MVIPTAGFSTARHEAVGGDQETQPRRTEAPWASPGWAVPRSLALDRSATAVDGDDRPGNIARARRGEESHDLGDLLDVRGTFEQCSGPQPCGALRGRTLGVHGAGGDGVHPHAAGAELRSPGTRHPREGALRRAVGRTTRAVEFARQ